MVKMTKQQTRKPALADPLPGLDPDALKGLARPPDENLPDTVGHMGIVTTGAESITAIHVAYKRDPNRVLAELKVHCAAFGQIYVYSWEVWNARENRHDIVEGVTIKAMNDLARIYGNCHHDIDEVVDMENEWCLKAVFIDKETGGTSGRPFLQSKGKNIGKGMSDPTRARDQIFQIGVSKALRNVIANALGSYAQYMLEESKKEFVGWVNKNRDHANNYVNRVCKQFGIDPKRVEASVGRLRKDWTDIDLARMMMKLRAVDEGMASPIDAFPSEDAAGEVMDAKQADKDKKAATAKAARKDAADTKPGDKPAAKAAATPKGKPTAKKKAAAKPAAAAAPEPAVDKTEPESAPVAEAEAQPEPETEPETEPEPGEPQGTLGGDDDEGWGD